MRILRNVVLYISHFILSTSLMGCGAVKMEIFGAKSQLPSVAPPQQPSGPPIPIGLFNLSLDKTIGKNRYLNFTDADPLIDAQNHMHFINQGGIYVLDQQGNQLLNIPLQSSTYDYRPFLYSGKFDRSPVTGKYYIAGSSNNQLNNSDILVVSADGTSISTFPMRAPPCYDPDAGDPSICNTPLQSIGANDLKLITRSDGKEEIHVLPFYKEPQGGIPGNQVDVYDATNGNFLRSYATTPTRNGPYYLTITQSPTSKDVFMLTNSFASSLLYHFSESSADLGTIALTGLKQAVNIAFDLSGKLYVDDNGDYLLPDGGPTAGIYVFNISLGPVYSLSPVRDLKSTVSHPISRPIGLAVNPNGTSLDFFNRASMQRERFNLVTGSYQFVEPTSSAGPGTNEFSLKSAYGDLGVIDVDSSENIYIDDFGNQRIKVYSPAGTFLRSFSTYHADIATEGFHFLAVTSQNKIIYVASQGDIYNVINLIIRRYTNTGVLEDTKILPYTNSYNSFVGIDSQDRFWLDSSSNSHYSLTAIDLSGTIAKTIDYTDMQATFGIAAGGMLRVLGSSIYILDYANYTTQKTDLDGNNITQFIDSNQLATAGLFAVIPSMLRRAGDGKIYSLAYNNTMTQFLLVAMDPNQNNDVVTKVASPDFLTLGAKIWNSQGVFALGGKNQAFHYLLQ